MTVTRGFVAGSAAVFALLAFTFGATASARADGQWLAGDLHVHTSYSHDSWGPEEDPAELLEEPYIVGHSVSSQFAVAATRGLDFMAITDHNDVRSQDDPGFGTNGVIGLPGYENSLDGHAQMLGATEVLPDTGHDAANVQPLADGLRAAPFNGAFQINHPAEGATGDELDWKLGYEVVPDTVEVWNISRLWQPPLPSASNNDDAVRFWEGFLDRGERVAATGGSDNHYLATTPIQGAGQPTTWVYAEDASAAGVLQGLRRGHTFISHQPPNLGGPQIFIEADEDGDGEFEAMAGDAVNDDATLRVRVSGAPAAMLRIVGTGGEEIGDPVPVTGPEFEHSFEVPDGTTWARAEIFLPDGAPERAQICDEQFGDQTTYCRNALGVLAMTSAIFLRPPEPPDPPGLRPPPTRGPIPTPDGRARDPARALGWPRRLARSSGPADRRLQARHPRRRSLRRYGWRRLPRRRPRRRPSERRRRQRPVDRRPR